MTEKLECKLLVFEDDPEIRAMLESYLTEQGAMVTTSKDGKNGCDLILKTSPDIVLMDVVMPYQDGLSILAELRQQNSDLPVILLTDRSDVDDKVKGLEIGADDYVTKPFSPKELSARIRAQLRRLTYNTSDSLDQIALGPMLINPVSREVLYEEKIRVPLTKTEFDLFSYLAARQNNVVHHDELLVNVLGYDPGVETKALVMHVANIRKKLASSCPAFVLIKAIAGVGYKLSTIQ